MTNPLNAPPPPHDTACLCGDCLRGDESLGNFSLGLPDGTGIPVRAATLARALRSARAESDALAGLERAARMHSHGAASNPSEWCPICKALRVVDAARAEPA